MSIVTHSTHAPSADERLADWADAYFRTGQHHRDADNLHFVAGGRNAYQSKHRDPIEGCPQPKPDLDGPPDEDPVTLYREAWYAGMADGPEPGAD